MFPHICLLVGGFLMEAIVAAGSPGLSWATAPSSQVGAAMAMLATLEDAQVLPPEGTPEANRVIKIVIQFQSVFMKSTDPAVREFFKHALVKKFGESGAGETDVAFYKTGWTSSVLEALEGYQASVSTSELEGLARGFSAFNVTLADFQYLTELFRKARLQYHQRGQDIHRAFAERRQGMPAARS
ncbi:MAG: hypothetical protein GDA67_02385 [Nitrospira sp. CR1.3]|nr:hypothetical protein [Nitrospira sp. CR1.3]